MRLEAIRPWGVYALVALFAFLAFKAGQAGLAGNYLQSARESAKGLGPPSSEKERWLQIQRDLAAARQHSPHDPGALRESGLNELRGMRSGLEVAPYGVHVRKAHDDFRSALRLRPATASDWANFALAKLYLGQWDAEMYGALRNAAELGPWESSVQREVLFVRLRVWPRLDEKERAETMRLIERAASRDPAQLGALLAFYDRLDLMCDGPMEGPRTREVCRSLRMAR